MDVWTGSDTKSVPICMEGHTYHVARFQNGVVTDFTQDVKTKPTIISCKLRNELHDLNEQRPTRSPIQIIMCNMCTSAYKSPQEHELRMIPWRYKDYVRRHLEIPDHAVIMESKTSAREQP